jgi:hypothetical protein
LIQALDYAAFPVKLNTPFSAKYPLSRHHHLTLAFARIILLYLAFV